MSTAGFDFVAIISERFMNRALAATYYGSTLPTSFEGRRRLLERTDTLGKLTEFDYIVRLKEPLIVDAFSKGKILLDARLEVDVKSSAGLSIRLDTEIHVLADPAYDVKTGLLRFELLEANVSDINLNESINVPAAFVDQVNNFLKRLISEGFMKKFSEIQVAPFLSSLELPGVAEGSILSIVSGKADVLSDEAVMLAVDLNEPGGDFSDITDFSMGNDFAIAVTKETLQTVFDDWWNNTTDSKQGVSTGSTDIQPIQELLDALTEALIEFPSKLFSLGFIDVDVEIIRVWLEFEAASRYGKPSYTLLKGGRAEITAPIKMDVTARVKAEISLDAYLDKSSFIPDKWLNWKLRPLTHRRRVFTISKFHVDNMDVHLDKAVGQLQLDETNRIVIKKEEVQVDVNLKWSLPKFVTGWLTDRLKYMISENFPDLYLFPATIQRRIPGMRLTLDAKVEQVQTLDKEVTLIGTLDFHEMQERIYPVPIFVADRSTMTLHRATCKFVEDIKEENKYGYYTLIDALRDGYADCRECIKECKAFKRKPVNVSIEPA